MGVTSVSLGGATATPTGGGGGTPVGPAGGVTMLNEVDVKLAESVIREGFRRVTNKTFAEAVPYFTFAFRLIEAAKTYVSCTPYLVH